uniref:Sulfurtransferase n=1 Tax=Branchiostoma floridae TaxID=7739 RepID=C3Z6U6_BRAFL|eukprot:XP_002595530.1 hypothetical protein BRAFLDRAFT_103518 [Branchiostoma floridae]
MSSVSTLVTVPWLAERLASPSLSSRVIRVLDCSWYLPKQKRDQRGEYKLQHIPGALFFDQEECCDKASPYENMLPSPEDFESYVGSLGVDNNTHVVVYDGSGADLSGPMVATCGSGMTACGLVLAAYLCGKEDVPVFDGAWVEWFKRAKPENIISEAKKE